MAVKTFTTGEVLTAADTNTYLNNGGLVYVSSGSFSNVTSVDITGFVSTYERFRAIVKIKRHTGSGLSAVTATVRSATTGAGAATYYGAGVSSNYLGTVASYAARNAQNDFAFGDVLNATYSNYITCDTGGYNAVGKNFQITGQFYNYPTTSSITFAYESTDVTIAYDRIRLACAVGVTGEWRLYGYREP